MPPVKIIHESVFHVGMYVLCSKYMQCYSKHGSFMYVCSRQVKTWAHKINIETHDQLCMHEIAVFISQSLSIVFFA